MDIFELLTNLYTKISGTELDFNPREDIKSNEKINNFCAQMERVALVEFDTLKFFKDQLA